MECTLQTEFTAFLNTDSLQERMVIASRVVHAVVMQSDIEFIKPDLANAIGALLGASGDRAPEVAAEIVKSAGANHGDIVFSAIAIAASVGENPEAVCAAAMEALPEGSTKTTQAIMAMPEQSTDENFRQTVLHATKGFKMISENWDAEQGKLKRDPFADYDDGETPCPRGIKGK